jgi:hypothetical protein
MLDPISIYQATSAKYYVVEQLYHAPGWLWIHVDSYIELGSPQDKRRNVNEDHTCVCVPLV